MTNLFTNFASDESGAVTVDWVVLTAALVGLGLAVMGVVRTGVQNVSQDITDNLCGVQIGQNFSPTTVTTGNTTVAADGTVTNC